MPLPLIPSPSLAAAQPLVLAGGIVLVSLVLEDAALVLAALLAALNILPVVLAWAAAFTGMFIGDLGVYWLARRVTSEGRHLAVRQAPTTTELVIARFSPGLRTLVWGWSGAARLPAGRFALTVFLSGLVWTGLVFSIAYLLGEPANRWLNVYAWFVLPMVAGWFAWRFRRSAVRKRTREEPAHG